MKGDEKVKHLGTIISTAIAGMFVMSVWGAFAGEYGIGGGWFAGTLIIGTMWYLNHVIGCHNNDGAWVDMALGIGVAGYVKPMFLDGIQVGIDSLPTLFWVLVGGVLGGVAARYLETCVFCEEE
jgi:hypothetical protein